jgi:peptidoglycan/LPS O-acetylase OafA/YrhL
MGIFRFILAASVVVAHSSAIPGISLLDAGMAVKTFFIISGFYMQLILDSKYGRVPNGTQLFYTNRALRIYPMYFLTLLLAVCFYLAATVKLGHPVDRLQYWTQAYNLGDYGQMGVIAVSQFTVIGLDVTPLFTFSPTLGFQLLTHPFPPDGVLAWRFNFLPHCWSIGAELFFYACMPFFNWCRTRSLIIGLLLASTICGLSLIYLPFSFAGPLDYHFGPMQLSYFLVGILSYRLIYKRILKGMPRLNWRLYVPLVIIAVLTFTPIWNADRFFPESALWLRTGYYALAALAVPILFHVTKTASWDRWIGELSYPMYLLHIPMKWVLLALKGVSVKDEAIVSGVDLLVLTVFAALVITYCVDRPMEKFRQRRFEREAQHSKPGLA